MRLVIPFHCIWDSKQMAEVYKTLRSMNVMHNLPMPYMQLRDKQEKKFRRETKFSNPWEWLRPKRRKIISGRWLFWRGQRKHSWCRRAWSRNMRIMKVPLPATRRTLDTMELEGQQIARIHHLAVKLVQEPNTKTSQAQKASSAPTWRGNKKKRNENATKSEPSAAEKS